MASGTSSDDLGSGPNRYASSDEDEQYNGALDSLDSSSNEASLVVVVESQRQESRNNGIVSSSMESDEIQQHPSLDVARPTGEKQIKPHASHLRRMMSWED